MECEYPSKPLTTAVVWKTCFIDRVVALGSPRGDFQRPPALVLWYPLHYCLEQSHIVSLSLSASGGIWRSWRDLNSSHFRRKTSQPARSPQRVVNSQSDVTNQRWVSCVIVATKSNTFQLLNPSTLGTVSLHPTAPFTDIFYEYVRDVV